MKLIKFNSDDSQLKDMIRRFFNKIPPPFETKDFTPSATLIPHNNLKNVTLNVALVLKSSVRLVM